MSFAFFEMRRRFAKVLAPLVSTLAGVAMLVGAVPSARATSVSAPEFPALVNNSDYIVRAVVKSVGSEFARPGSRKIVTKVELEVKEVIAGTPPSPLVLTMLGGKVGEQEMTVEGAPKFTVGEEDVLFVQGNGKQIIPLVAIMHGRYPVLQDATSGRKYMARNNRVPLEDTAEVALPMTSGDAAAMQQRLKSTTRALSPEQFAGQIKAIAKAKSSSEKLK